MQSALSGFYYANYGAKISVDLVMYDMNGVETNVMANSVKNVYTITVLKALTAASTGTVGITKISTTSSISYTLPKDVQLSSPPLTGMF